MKNLLLPLSTIASWSGIAFVVGTQLGMKQTNTTAAHPPLTPQEAEEAIAPEPKNDLETTCHTKDCKQTKVTQDLVEFQSRLQRIMDRAEADITKLRHESTMQFVEVSHQAIQPIREDMQTDIESNLPSGNMQQDFLKQVVASSLQATDIIRSHSNKLKEQNNLDETLPIQ